MEAVVTCVKCKHPLVSTGIAAAANVPFNNGEVARCPACGARTIVDVFPAMFLPASNSHAAEKIISEEEAACFYHPQKKASVPCDNCGRFLCALCDVELNGQHICPSCLQSGKKKGKIKNLDNQRTLYDHIALATAILPVIIVFPTLITAPIAIYLSIRHWNSPTSVLPRMSRLRFVIAIILSLLQIAFWVLFFASKFWKR